MKEVKKSRRYLSLLLALSLVLTLFQGIGFTKAFASNFTGRIFPDYSAGTVEFRFKADGKDCAYVAGAFNGWQPRDTQYGDKYKMTWIDTGSGYWEMVAVISMDDLGRPQTAEEYNNNKNCEFKFILVKSGQSDQWVKRDGTDNGNDGFEWDSYAGAPSTEAPRINAAVMDSKNSIQAFLDQPASASASFELCINDVKQEGITADVNGNVVNIDTRSIADSLTPNALIEIRTGSPYKYTPVTLRRMLDEYVYTGSDMGLSYNNARNEIGFRLWAPTAHKVELLTYNNDGRIKEAADGVHQMLHDETSGTYYITLNKADADSKYYLYRLYFKTRNTDGQLTDRITYAVDPYAIATGLNGKMGYIADISSDMLKPSGFDTHSRPELSAPEDSVIYEMHVRDFTIDDSWGGRADYAGKFLGIAQTGTKISGSDIRTGLDHLVELGVSHVHLLPVYDIASIEEDGSSAFDARKANGIDYNRNWGYDPQNYNALEGSYSTDPSDPVKVIKEFREMVQTLHQNGIRVVLDKVYNHMYGTDNMDSIVPGYYFRSNERGIYTNGSGCGNELASERPMVRRFIVDSNKMWLKNYMVDGLRFDLMALIDKTTMNEIKDEAKRIDPSIIVYGEPWKADYSPLEEHEQTKKNNAGIAAFNDEYRDALRGNNNPSKGFVHGAIGDDNSNKVQEGLRGSISHTVSDPELMINYAEAHDNYAIFDQIEKAENNALADGNYRQNIGADALSNWKVKKAILANGFVLTSQGIPFFQGGSEILRTKQGDHNSYKSSDTINAIHWADKTEYKEVFDYYKGLIKLRKEHPAFRLTTSESVRANQDVYRLNNDNELILQHLKNNANGDRWKNILVLYNGSINNKTVTWLPAAEGGKWKVIFDDKGLHNESGTLREIAQTSGSSSNVNFEIPSGSLMVLFDAEGKADNLQWDYLFADQSADYMSPLEPTKHDDVKVRFRSAKGEVTSAVLHYYDAELKTEKQVQMTRTGDGFYAANGYDKDKLEFWEGVIPAGESVKYYNFEVKNERIGKTVWISGGAGANNRGISENRPVFAGGGTDYGFSVVPDYKTPDWAKESVFYQIMVDRFRDGDSGNNRVAKDLAGAGNPSEISAWNGKINDGNESDKIWNNQFFGGDLTGVREAIPYLKNELGITSVYLMPIFQSGSDHKYDADDYEFVDGNFGGNRALAELSKEMKSNGLHLVLDGVFNHTSAENRLFKENKEKYYFYTEGGYKDIDGKVVDFYPWHGYSSLAKLDYSKDEVRNYIYRNEDSIARSYLKEPYNISGWRLDAAEDVNVAPRDYVKNPVLDVGTTQEDARQREENLKIWQEFNQAVRSVKSDAYILGEFWGNDNQWYYGRAWDSKMNYGGFLLPFVENSSGNKYLGNQSLDNKNGMSVADIGRFTRNYFKAFPYQTILSGTNSISTHDKARFLNREFAGAGNAAMMELAAALQLTYPGVPMIYYGDEIGTVGAYGRDPYNRGTFNWDAASWSGESKEMLKDHKILIAARKTNKDAFVYGAFEEIKSHNDDQYIAYARYGKGSRAIVILNNSNKNTVKSIELDRLERYGFKNGDILKDVMTGAVVDVANGRINVSSKDMSAMVLVPANKAPAVDSKIRLDLNDYSDGRVKLAAVSGAKYEKAQDGIAIEWDSYAQTGAKEISVRIYSDSDRLLAEKRVKPDETAVKFAGSEMTGIGDSYEIVLQAIADRTLKINASDAVNDGYANSIFTTAVKKSTTQSSGGGTTGGSAAGGGSSSQTSGAVLLPVEDASDTVDSKTEQRAEKEEAAVFEAKDKEALAVRKEEVLEVLEGGKAGLTAETKHGAVTINKAALSRVFADKSDKAPQKLSVSLKQTDITEKERAAVEKALAGGSLVSEKVFAVSAKADRKAIEATNPKERLDIAFNIRLDNASNGLYVLDIKTGKSVRAKYNKKKGMLRFKLTKAGRLVIVKKSVKK